MADMQFGLMMRAQFPQGDDMQVRFREMLEQARLADELGYSCITNGMHYSSAPWQDFQQFPFLCRMMAEAPNMRLNFGLILLSLHKPLDIAEQIATVDVMSGGKVIFGVALGYREVEFLAFGTTQRERVKRFEENLEAIKRLWTEDAVDMAGSHFTLQGASAPTRPLQKPHPLSGSAPMLTRPSGGPHASGIAGTSTRTTALTPSSGKLRCTSGRSTHVASRSPGNFRRVVRSLSPGHGLRRCGCARLTWQRSTRHITSGARARPCPREITIWASISTI